MNVYAGTEDLTTTFMADTSSVSVTRDGVDLEKPSATDPNRLRIIFFDTYQGKNNLFLLHLNLNCDSKVENFL